MAVQHIFSNVNLNIINLVAHIRLMFLSMLFEKFNIGEKGKKNSSVNHRIDRVQINNQVERVLKEYGNSILRLAYSYLHHINDAEDVLQDTIIQYIKSNPRFENPRHEKAWLMRVAINISKNKII